MHDFKHRASDVRLSRHGTDPIADEPSRMVRAAAAPRAGSILVLEDDALNAMMIEEALRAQGHTVLGPARTVGHALALLDHHRVDAALLDLQIDDGLSLEVGARLDLLGIPWAIMTAHATDDLPPACAHVAHLEKPFALPHLFHLVDRLLSDGDLCEAGRIPSAYAPAGRLDRDRGSSSLVTGR